MQIKYKGADRFEIKSKDVEVAVSSKISILGFELPGAGEYEKSGVSVFGISDGENIINVLHLEGISLCHLGHINHDLSEEETKQIGDIDILFLPLGQDNSVSEKIALKLVSKIDPKIVIPMLYDDLTEFKKSEGVADAEMDILKVRKIDLTEEERKVIILKSS